MPRVSAPGTPAPRRYCRKTVPRSRSEPYPGKVHRPGLRPPARGVDESLTGARSGTPRPRDLKLGTLVEPVGPSRTPPPPSRYPAWGPGTAPPNVRKFDRPYLGDAESQELETRKVYRPRGPLSDAASPEPVDPMVGGESAPQRRKVPKL